MAGLPPTGWYTDPKDSNRERFWDGERWTPRVRIKSDRKVDSPTAATTPTAPRPIPAEEIVKAKAASPPTKSKDLNPVEVESVTEENTDKRKKDWLVLLGLKKKEANGAAKNKKTAESKKGIDKTTLIAGAVILGLVGVYFFFFSNGEDPEPVVEGNTTVEPTDSPSADPSQDPSPSMEPSTSDSPTVDPSETPTSSDEPSPTDTETTTAPETIIEGEPGGSVPFGQWARLETSNVKGLPVTIAVQLNSIKKVSKSERSWLEKNSDDPESFKNLDFYKIDYSTKWLEGADLRYTSNHAEFDAFDSSRAAIVTTTVNNVDWCKGNYFERSQDASEIVSSCLVAAPGKGDEVPAGLMYNSSGTRYEDYPLYFMGE